MIDPTAIDFLHPHSFIEEEPGSSPSQNLEEGLPEYFKRKKMSYTWKAAVFGASFLVFLFFITYHVISKIRRNEKNTNMNNQAILLSFLGLYSYAILFVDWVAFVWFNEKATILRRSHWEKYLFTWWTASASLLLFHTCFTVNYVRTTLKLPPLIEITKVYNEILEKIPEREFKQQPLTTPQELEDTQKKIEKTKRSYYFRKNY